MTLIVNRQEYNALKEWLPSDTMVEEAEELGTDAVVQGLEKNRMYERKELPDFLASIIDGRFFAQLKVLSDNKDKYEPFIIIEGQGFYNHSVKKWQSLKAYFDANPQRKMAFYEAQAACRAFGVGQIWTVDKADTALLLTYENVKLGKPKEKKDYPERRGFKKDWTVEQKRLYFMEAFGLETGKALTGTNPPIKFFSGLCDCEECNCLNTRERAIEWIADSKLPSGRRLGKAKAEEIYQVIHG